MRVNDNAAKQLSRQSGMSVKEAGKAVANAYTNDVFTAPECPMSGIPAPYFIKKRGNY